MGTSFISSPLSPLSLSHKVGIMPLTCQTFPLLTYIMSLEQRTVDKCQRYPQSFLAMLSLLIISLESCHQFVNNDHLIIDILLNSILLHTHSYLLVATLLEASRSTLKKGDDPLLLILKSKYKHFLFERILWAKNNIGSAVIEILRYRQTDRTTV